MDVVADSPAREAVVTLAGARSVATGWVTGPRPRRSYDWSEHSVVLT